MRIPASCIKVLSNRMFCKGTLALSFPLFACLSVSLCLPLPIPTEICPASASVSPACTLTLPGRWGTGGAERPGAYDFPSSGKGWKRL